MEALKKIVNIFGISGTVSESKVFETNKIWTTQANINILIVKIILWYIVMLINWYSSRVE